LAFGGKGSGLDATSLEIAKEVTMSPQHRRKGMLRYTVNGCHFREPEKQRNNDGSPMLMVRLDFSIEMILKVSNDQVLSYSIFIQYLFNIYFLMYLDTSIISMMYIYISAKHWRYKDEQYRHVPDATKTIT
jgi:hypothetical protein